MYYLLQGLERGTKEAHAITYLLYEGWAYIISTTVWVDVNYYNLWFNSNTL